MKSQVHAALEEGRKLVFVDEAMFTTAGRTTLAYASKNKNVSLDEAKSNVKSIAVVAGVSVDNGFDFFMICPKSINSQLFIRFLDRL